MTEFQDNTRKFLAIMKMVKNDGFTIYHGYVWEKKEMWEGPSHRICAIEEYPIKKHNHA